MEWNGMSGLGKASVRGLMCVCVCACEHVFGPVYTRMSMCEGKRERKAKLTFPPDLGCHPLGYKLNQWLINGAPLTTTLNEPLRELLLPVLITLSSVRFPGREHASTRECCT